MNAEELKVCHHILNGHSATAHLRPSIKIQKVTVVTVKYLPTPVIEIQYRQGRVDHDELFFNLWELSNLLQ